MKHFLMTTLLTLCCLSASSKDKGDIYKFNVRGADGKEMSMKDFKGKVLLIVNTATYCGFTPQYKELQKLYDTYKDKGLEILDFPCNQFGEQAPGSIVEIRDFCTSNFHTTFPLFDKVDVNGDKAEPLFVFLKEQQPFKGFDKKDQTGKFMDQMLRKKDAEYDKNPDIKWNFTKFLVDRKGKVIRRFEPTESMMNITRAIKSLL
ncbi:MAG: glutathione peroxidase [Bacteroidaceae bacterium]|nr:glutathione peroxidase [Bacteroidaceae bacterium]